MTGQVIICRVCQQPIEHFWQLIQDHATCQRPVPPIAEDDGAQATPRIRFEWEWHGGPPEAAISADEVKRKRQGDRPRGRGSDS